MSREDLIQEVVASLAKCQRPANFSGWHKIGLSHAQLGMLYMLSYHKKLQIKQAADFLGISKSAASQQMDPLADKGLVNRQSDPKDRRIAYFSLSDKGRQVVKKLQKFKYAGLRSRLAALNDKELEQLAKLYRKMASSPTQN